MAFARLLDGCDTLFGQKKKDMEITARVKIRNVSECTQTINTTVVPYEYFTRYERLIEDLKNLISFKGKIKLIYKNEGKHWSFEFFEGLLKETMEKMESVTESFIDRCFDNSVYRAYKNIDSATKVEAEFLTIDVWGRRSMTESNKKHYEFKLFDLREKLDYIEKNRLNYDNMDGHQFEHFCADLLRKNGFVNVKVTSGSGDYGVDILAAKDGITYAIQCKCYTSNIGNTAVQEAFTGKEFYKRHVGIVLTNQYFTPAAKETAERTGIILWDRDWLDRMINHIMP